MPDFEYQGRNARTGEAIEGQIRARSRDEAVAYLRQEKHIDVSTIHQIKKATNVEDIVGRFMDVPFEEIVTFTRNVATMVEAGITILDVMETMVNQTENQKFKAVLEKVLGDIASGMLVHEALAPHTEVFDKLYVAMVRAGEMSGDLGKSMSQLAIQIEQTQKIRRAIKSAMIYPKVVVGISFFIVSALMISIVPRFAKIYQDTASQLSTPEKPISPELPGPTRVAVSISRLLYPEPGPNGHTLMWWAQSGLRLLIFFVLIVVLKKLYKIARRNPKFARRFDALKLKLPFKIGSLNQKIAIARFARTLSSLRAAGVDAIESLSIVAEAAGNYVVTEMVLKVQQEVIGGSEMHPVLARSGIFPPMVVKYVEIGERTGEIELLLEKLAINYEQEVEMHINGLTKLIEPLMIIVVGAVIGGIVIATYLPMFNLYNLLQ